MQCQTESQPHMLMCPPDYFGIEYVINPWMDIRRKADHGKAVHEWHALHAILESAGAKFSLLPPQEGLPDLVFTANAALIYRQLAVLARFKPTQRQGEEPVFREWLESAGFEVIDAPAGCAFEGAGDALFCGDTLFAGYRMRSDARGMQEIGAMLGVRVIPLELVDSRYYHVDTCFCPLTPDTAIYHPDAFDDYGRRALETHVERLVAVRSAEAERFACNAVVVGEKVITNTGCGQLHRDLATMGYEPIATPLDEFIKAGGSAKCLTLRLDGEDAASWRNA